MWLKLDPCSCVAKSIFEKQVRRTIAVKSMWNLTLSRFQDRIEMGYLIWNRYVDTSMNTNMFLGGSVSLSPVNTSQVGSFCAHGWIDEQMSDKDAYHVLNPSGRCWLFNPRNGNVEHQIFPFIQYCEFWDAFLTINILKRTNYWTILQRSNSKTEVPLQPTTIPMHREECPAHFLQMVHVCTWEHQGSINGVDRLPCTKSHHRTEAQLLFMKVWVHLLFMKVWVYLLFMKVWVHLPFMKVWVHVSMGSRVNHMLATRLFRESSDHVMEQSMWFLVHLVTIHTREGFGGFVEQACNPLSLDQDLVNISVPLYLQLT